MLTCKELTELVTDYVEGRLPWKDRLRFYMHISMCKHCRAYVRQMKLTIKTLGKLPDKPIPPEIREELLERFANWKPSPGTRKSD